MRKIAEKLKSEINKHIFSTKIENIKKRKILDTTLESNVN